MVKCSFCDNEIEKGTGILFVLKDGKILNFCSSKCEKNQLKLKRKGRELKWTKTYEKQKGTETKGIKGSRYLNRGG